MQISIEHINKKYGRKTVLRDITFSATDGECIGLLGGNGSGKSTLLSILAGVQRSDGGEFLCDGENLFKAHKQRNQKVGYIPQGTPLIEELTAWDNLLLWYDKESLKKELSDGVLSMLGINEFIKTTVSKMSGGMKKRLSIGCSVANKQSVLLLDEPTAALDLICKEKITQYLKEHKKSGGIVLLATHDVLELELCDRWYIIKDGVLEPFEYKGDVQRLVESL